MNAVHVALRNRSQGSVRNLTVTGTPECETQLRLHGTKCRAHPVRVPHRKGRGGGACSRLVPSDWDQHGVSMGAAAARPLVASHSGSMRPGRRARSLAGEGAAAALSVSPAPMSGAWSGAAGLTWRGAR